MPDARTGDIFCSVATKRFARREDLGLKPAEFALLRRLDSPRKIQAYLYGLRRNFEVGGDTCRPVRAVLRTRSAHCIEGAMLAACAMWIQGEPPLLLDMRAVREVATSAEFKSAMEKVETPVHYLDAPDFKRYWERDAARLKLALEKIGKVEEK